MSVPSRTLRAGGWRNIVSRRSGRIPLETQPKLLRVLEQTQWAIDGERGAARILGLNPSTLRGRLRKLGIRKNS